MAQKKKTANASAASNGGGRSASPAPTSPNTTTSTSKRTGTFLTSFLTTLLPLLLLVLPALLSHQIGGWTSKYLTNPPRFSSTQIPPLNGKVAIVTGASTGLGYETALRLVLAGAEVVLTTRSKAKGEATVSRIVERVAETYPAATEVRVKHMVLNLDSLRSVRSFAKSFKRLRIPLHVLVLNAGVMKSPGQDFAGRNFSYGYELTEDGFERHVGVNHVGHFYLTNQLMSELKKGGKEDGGSRVVVVSSSSQVDSWRPEGMRFDTFKPQPPQPTAADTNDEQTDETAVAPPDWYEDGRAYSQSKLANVLFARQLAKIMAGTGVTAYSVHPGVIVDTDLSRYLTANKLREETSGERNWVDAVKANANWVLTSQACMSVEDGALNQLWAATAPPDEMVNGGYYWPIGLLVEPPTVGKSEGVGGLLHPQAGNETLAELLWNVTEHLIADFWRVDAERAKAAKLEKQAEEVAAAAAEEAEVEEEEAAKEEKDGVEEDKADAEAEAKAAQNEAIRRLAAAGGNMHPMAAAAAAAAKAQVAAAIAANPNLVADAAAKLDEKSAEADSASSEDDDSSDDSSDDDSEDDSEDDPASSSEDEAAKEIAADEEEKEEEAAKEKDGVEEEKADAEAEARAAQNEAIGRLAAAGGNMHPMAVWAAAAAKAAQAQVAAAIAANPNLVADAAAKLDKKSAEAEADSAGSSEDDDSSDDSEDDDDEEEDGGNLSGDPDGADAGEPIVQAAGNMHPMAAGAAAFAKQAQARVAAALEANPNLAATFDAAKVVKSEEVDSSSEDDDSSDDSSSEDDSSDDSSSDDSEDDDDEEEEDGSNLPAVVTGCGQSDYPKIAYGEAKWNKIRDIYFQTVGEENCSISSTSESGIQVPYEVRSGKKGRGVFVTAPVKEGSKVWSDVHHAVFYSEASFRRFLAKLPYDEACDILLWAYVEKWGDDNAFVAACELDDGSFINHGETEEETTAGGTEGDVYASRDINAGEEILMNYTLFYEFDKLVWFDEMRAAAWREDQPMIRERLGVPGQDIEG